MQFIEELTDKITNANIVKSLVLEKLVEEKLISKEEADKFDETYQITVINSSWFPVISRLLKAIKKDYTPQYVYKFIKYL